MASLGKHLSIAAQVRRIKRNLNSVVEKTSERIEGSLFTQAALLAAEIKGLAPVDSSSETPGALRDSVRVERGSPTAKKAVVVKIKAGGPRTLKQGKSGKPYNYARAVEFGTQDMQPKPFFFPIYRARRKAIRAATRKAISNAVKDTFK